MDETIGSTPCRGARCGDLGGLGRVRMATLAGGSAALALVGWCGAYVSRSLGPGPATLAAPSIVLAPAAGPVIPPAPAATPVVADGGTAASAHPVSVAAPARPPARASSASPGPRALSALSVEVPVPVRTTRLELERSAAPDVMAAAAGGAAQANLALASPSGERAGSAMVGSPAIGDRTPDEPAVSGDQTTEAWKAPAHARPTATGSASGKHRDDHHGDVDHG